MGWSDWPSWVKGGVIGVIVAFIVMIITNSLFRYWYVTILLLLTGFIFGILTVVLFYKIKGPYWLRGGIIGLILGLFCPFIFIYIGSIPEIIRENLNPFGLFESETMGMIFVFFGIPSLIILIVLGVIIGAVIGKMRGEA
jgi:hypothetical protein